jgi:hypothetical protein
LKKTTIPILQFIIYKTPLTLPSAGATAKRSNAGKHARLFFPRTGYISVFFTVIRSVIKKTSQFYYYYVIDFYLGILYIASDTFVALCFPTIKTLNRMILGL